MPLDGGETRTLAHFVSGLGARDIPEKLEGILRQAVTDSVGCAIFGLETEACRIVADYARDQGGPDEASLWAASHAPRVSMANAALGNATAVHGFDFDDHSRAKIHPGAAVIPAAMAAAEARGCDGRRFLTAIAAGYEVMNRVSLAAGPNAARMRGWHLTGTTGTFGAAAAASVVFGLDIDGTASALGIAGSQSSGTWAFNADGAMNKRLHPGLAARAGVTAADLASRGFRGAGSVLETPDGGLLSAMSDEARPDLLTRELGSRWHAADACFKPYACCGSNHAAIDAATQLMREHGLAVAHIERIRIGVSHVVLLQTGFEYRRSSVLNAQMSIRYNVAVALLDGTALVEQFTEERLADPEIEALIARTEVEVDAEMDALYPTKYAGIVSLVLKDGRELTARVDHSKGMPENPMTADELKAKFLSLTVGRLGEAPAERLFADLQEVFDLPDVAPLAGQIGECA